MNTELAKISKKIVETLILQKQTISTAESCTGGLISTCLTEIPGSSQCFSGGVCTYTEKAKTHILGISHDEIQKYGVVSQLVASNMAKSIRQILQSDFAISTTGIAGPEGGSPQIPVGTIWCGIASRSGSEAFCLHLEGNRNMIRNGAVIKLLTNLYDKHLKEQV